MKNLFLLFILLTLFSCSEKKKNADLIIHNALVYTVDSAFSIQQSFAIKDGKILAVGSDKEILQNYEAENKIDMQKKAVYPGLIDAHCHFYGYSTDLVKCDLYGTKSFEEVLERVKAYSPKNKFSWILGRGWDQNDWATKEFPDKTELDKLFPDVPVFLMRIDGHAILVNQKALDMANINSNTKIKGGEVEIKNGKLTGILIDNVVDSVKKLIPEFSNELKAEALMIGQKNCFEVGLTTVSDAGLEHDKINLIDSLQKAGVLKMRMYAMITYDEVNKKHFFEKGIYKTENLNVRSFKVYADGALGSRGACLISPYSDKQGHHGFLLHDKNYLKNAAKEIYEHGFQMNTHCIGDSSDRFILDTYAENLKGKNDRRWRIEHSQVVDKNDLSKYGEYSIIPSVQPTHATSDMYWAETRLGKERVKQAYAYKSLLQQNNLIALGTDFPVEHISPIYTFYAAVVRKDHKGFPEGGYQMENALTKEEALKGMTIWAAYSNFEEKEKGSLEPGKYADFIVLDKDIMKISEKEILSVKVLNTYVGGEKVFGK